MSPGRLTDSFSDRTLKGGGKGDPPPALKIIAAGPAASGLFDCNTGFALFSASGGRKPYIWTADKGMVQVSGEFSENMKLLKPASIMAGPDSDPNRAYSVMWYSTCTDPPNIVNPFVKCRTYTCLDTDFSQCQGAGEDPCDPGPFTTCGVCGNKIDGCPACPTMVMALCADAIPSGNCIKDNRGPLTKAAGCKPCRAEMSGVIITLQDAKGRAVSIVLTGVVNPP